MAPRHRVLAIVLAGGEGKRLMPLTADRAKPAVPFGGSYRLIDFVLSNLVNAGYLRICVLTQYKSHSLNRHITTAWSLTTMLGNYITSVPAQQRLGQRWYTGSADAILQSLNLIQDEQPDYVAVFGADHVYRMNPAEMVQAHIDSGAGVTVAGVRVPRHSAHDFGIIEVQEGSTQIAQFWEKPSDPPPVPGDPDSSFASMGNYVFSTQTLIDALHTDSEDESSKHDLGTNIIPMLTQAGQAHVYDFALNHVPGSSERDRHYWRDVGSIDAYYDAHMDLISVEPIFNLYNKQWPIHTELPPLPPAKFVEAGTAHDSMVGTGTIVSGGHVRDSVISHNVRIDQGSFVAGSVLLPGVSIGKNAIVRRAILDRNVVVADDAQIGVDPVLDAQRFTISAEGVIVVPKNAYVGR
ncbi:MAG: glucose-1-phosphate adenylyltransferase [Actinobacteria bacterium]|nr:glucose-1-phosphate adenylyltransferase [Actinomycetota bacterium]